MLKGINKLTEFASKKELKFYLSDIHEVFGFIDELTDNNAARMLLYDRALDTGIMYINKLARELGFTYVLNPDVNMTADMKMVYIRENLYTFLNANEKAAGAFSEFAVKLLLYKSGDNYTVEDNTDMSDAVLNKLKSKYGTQSIVDAMMEDKNKQKVISSGERFTLRLSEIGNLVNLIQQNTKEGEVQFALYREIWSIIKKHISIVNSRCNARIEVPINLEAKNDTVVRAFIQYFNSYMMSDDRLHTNFENYRITVAYAAIDGHLSVYDCTGEDQADKLIAIQRLSERLN